MKTTPPDIHPAARRLHARHRIDARARDYLAMAWACVVAWRRSCQRGRLEQRAGSRAIAFLSVRSAFDAALTALDVRAGDEIVMSGVTIPDMQRIACAHGLTVRVLDVDPRTMLPSPVILDAAITPRTRAVVIAQLFGGRADLSALAAVARVRGVPLIEDAAQALTTPRDICADVADVALFSFGPLKTATALGGALAQVRDPRLGARMRSLQTTWPVQSRRAYLARVLRYSLLAVLARPRPYARFVRRVERRGHDRDTYLNSLTRSFGDADDVARLLASIRQQPAAPLLASLRRRLRRFPLERTLARTSLGDRIGSSAPALLHVGRAHPQHSHWLVPLASFKAPELVDHLRARGFDATLFSHAHLAAMDDAPIAASVLARTVLVPAYPELGAAAERLVCELRCWREFDAVDLGELRAAMSSRL
jgi:dTDP-4-amino-4,6-dideoxygalactose transaminase